MFTTLISFKKSLPHHCHSLFVLTSHLFAQSLNYYLDLLWLSALKWVLLSLQCTRFCWAFSFYCRHSLAWSSSCWVCTATMALVLLIFQKCPLHFLLERFSGVLILFYWDSVAFLFSLGFSQLKTMEELRIWGTIELQPLVQSFWNLAASHMSPDTFPIEYIYSGSFKI